MGRVHCPAHRPKPQNNVLGSKTSPGHSELTLRVPDHTVNDLTPFRLHNKHTALCIGWKVILQSLPDGSRDFFKLKENKLFTPFWILNSSIIMHCKMLHFIVPGNSDHENEGEIILSRERVKRKGQYKTAHSNIKPRVLCTVPHTFGE